MKFVQIGITILGGVLLFLFALPIVLKRICNIGNVTGIIIALFLLGYGVRVAQWNAWLQEIWQQSRAGKIILSILMGIAALISGIVIAETISLYRACHMPAPEAATVVVLGCKVNGERPSRTLQERIDAAYVYLDEHPDAKAVLSGGQGSDEGIAESECMERELVKRGIAKERLYQENRSTSTKENLAFSYEVIQKEHLNESIVLITSEFHAYRATQIAKAQGLQYGTYSARTAWWLLPTYYMRELYGILWQWICR
ncbi:MAG: YdcF family protein [Lachnospiraceae bacterium]